MYFGTEYLIFNLPQRKVRDECWVDKGKNSGREGGGVNSILFSFKWMDEKNNLWL